MQRLLVNLLRLILAAALLAGGVQVFKHLRDTKPEAERVPEEVRGTLVRAFSPQPQRRVRQIMARGVVMPARQVILQPEVSGRVIEMHPQLFSGGHLRAGEELLRINDQDYSLMVTQQRANVERAALEVDLERSRRAVAEREWELLDEGDGEHVGRDLALREPQQRAARASLNAARSALTQARRSVEKTHLEVPFNAMILNENVDIGQLISPAAPVATLIGTDAFWVQVSVPLEELSSLVVPGFNAPISSPPPSSDEGGAGGEERAGPSAAQSQGSEVKVWSEGRREGTERVGRVLRLLGDVDPMGHQVRLLIEIQDPLDLQRAPAARRLPMLLGSQVAVQLPNEPAENVYVLPVEALRDDDLVWLVSDESTLSTRQAEVLWRERDEVVVRGLVPGDEVITSELAAPVDGMLLQLSEEEDAPGDAASPASSEGDDAEQEGGR